MSISSVSSSTIDWSQYLSSSTSTSTSSSSTSSGTSKSDPSEDFDALQEALDSGDLETAKELFAKIQENAPPPPPDGAQGTESGDDQRTQDFDALQEALEAGDVEAAQSAFETIKSNMPSEPPSFGGVQASQSVSTDGVGTLLDLVA